MGRIDRGNPESSFRRWESETALSEPATFAMLSAVRDELQAEGDHGVRVYIAAPNQDERAEIALDRSVRARGVDPSMVWFVMAIGTERGMPDPEFRLRPFRATQSVAEAIIRELIDSYA